MTTKVETYARSLMTNAAWATATSVIFSGFMAWSADVLTAVAVFFWLAMYLLGMIAYYTYQIWNEVSKDEVGE